MRKLWFRISSGPRHVIEHRSRLERMVTHLTLVTGALLFSFPFVWMLCTSTKLPREMTSDRVRVLPDAPHPRDTSPYLGADEYGEPGCPDGFPPRLEAGRARCGEQLDRLLSQSPAQTVGPDDNAPPRHGRRRLPREMRAGLIRLLALQFSDDARGRALAVERQRRLAAVPGAQPPHDSVLEATLSAEAVRAGVDALRPSAAPDHRGQRRRVFDDCYRRFALGAVRLRTKDYAFHTVASGHGWTVADGPAALVSRKEGTVPVQEVRLQFEAGRQSAEITLAMDTAALAALGVFGVDDIDRLYVAYRPDNSWARVRLRSYGTACATRRQRRTTSAIPCR